MLNADLIQPFDANPPRLNQVGPSSHPGQGVVPGEVIRIAMADGPLTETERTPRWLSAPTSAWTQAQVVGVVR